MSTVHAFAIHQIGTRILGKKTFVRASEKGKPSVFITTRDELKKLEALGAAREASKEEIAVAEVQESVVDASVKEAPVEPKAETADAGGKPPSNAPGDPQANRKGTKATEAKAETKAADDAGTTGAATGSNDADI